MKRVGKTGKFRRAVAEAFLERLPGHWETQGPPDSPRLLLLYPWGAAGLRPKMTFKGLPGTRVSFAYGLSFNELSPLLARLDESSGFGPVDFFDVHQDSFNRPLPGKERGSEVADYNACDFGAIYDDLLSGAEGELLGFFSHFSDLREVRRSLEDDDGSFLSYGSAGVITAIDCLLDDVEHLRRFHTSLRDSGGARAVEHAAGVLGISL
jgi:hypothetical protein